MNHHTLRCPGALFITTLLFYDAYQGLWVQALGKIAFYVYSFDSYAIYCLGFHINRQEREPGKEVMYQAFQTHLNHSTGLFIVSLPAEALPHALFKSRSVSHRVHAHSALTVETEDVSLSAFLPQSIVTFWKKGTTT